MKKFAEFLFISRNIYLFIRIDVVHFKAIPIGYNTFVPALFPIIKIFLKHTF